jgi:hypothetical protein
MTDSGNEALGKSVMRRAVLDAQCNVERYAMGTLHEGQKGAMSRMDMREVDNAIEFLLGGPMLAHWCRCADLPLENVFDAGQSLRDRLDNEIDIQLNK